MVEATYGARLADLYRSLYRSLYRYGKSAKKPRDLRQKRVSALVCDRF